MQSKSFGDFQIGQVDNPSIEDGGGFEFASGMDIFSEPGVLKANFAMVGISGFSPSNFSLWMKTTTHGGTLKGYLAHNDKIYESTDGITWSLFLTNAEGQIVGLEIWNGYIMYASATKLGRCPVGTAGSKDDDWQTIDSGTYHPMVVQGGTLKIACGRYAASVDEAFAFTAQAMKVPVDYVINTLAVHQNLLFGGTRLGPVFDSPVHDGMIFSWRGTILSSGAALPDATYPLSKRGTNLLVSSGQGLFALPDKRGEVMAFNGANFVPYRQLTLIANNSDLRLIPSGGFEHLESVIFGGDSSFFPGVFQIKNGALNQPFVPAAVNPCATEQIVIGFVASAFNGKVLFSYHRPSDNSYHIEYLGTNRQNNAVIRTLWHRMGTDRLKRWAGVKLNLKDLPASTSVKVEYRTDRNAAFTDPGISITSSNQDKPAIFAAQPRTKEIQFRFTYTTATTNTPELLSYDPIFELLKTVRK